MFFLGCDLDGHIRNPFIIAHRCGNSSMKSMEVKPKPLEVFALSNLILHELLADILLCECIIFASIFTDEVNAITDDVTMTSSPCLSEFNW